LGPAAGGCRILEVHHIERDPGDCDVHDPANLQTICRKCHNWHHNQATREDAPVEITEEDLQVLLSQDIEILQYLAAEGPATTSDIGNAVTVDHTDMSVRRRLWVLMGLDNLVAEREEQIVGKDRDSGEWGLVEQIETPSRGHIPGDAQALFQRIVDAQTWQALRRGVDRAAIAEAFDITQRTTFDRQKRGAAYGFPLGAMKRQHGRRSSEQGVVEDDDGQADAGGQQRLAALVETTKRMEQAPSPEIPSETEIVTAVEGAVEEPAATDGGDVSENAAAVKTQLDEGIEHLEEISTLLGLVAGGA
jgi:hypothetical protein